MGAAATDLDFEPFHSELTTASGISLQEQVKWADFRDDARRQGLDLAHCPGWQLPGEVFVWFKDLMLLRWPRPWWGNCQAGDPAPGGNPASRATAAASMRSRASTAIAIAAPS